MNLAALAQKLDLDEPAYRELVALFVDASRTDVEELRAALRCGDRMRADRATHSLRGAAANVGLDEISAMAHVIQDRLRGGQEPSILEAAERLERLLLTVSEALRS